MKIHKEGRKIILIEIAILTLIWYFFPELNILLVILILFTMLTIYFFRVPNRELNIKENYIYAPCDGKIVVIEKTVENEYYKDKRIQISIFMSPLNIHNNLYPISGEIAYTKYHPGKFLFAWNPKASTKNERSTIVINNKKISILIRQIAGALARRIITYPKKNDQVNAGNELGFIKFGSRVDLFLPESTIINVKLKEKVIGGKTIIGIY